MLKKILIYLGLFLFASACVVGMDEPFESSDDSSDSADGKALKESYPEERLSPFYDINPFAYDLSPYTEKDILESSWRQMFGDINDPLYEQVSEIIDREELGLDIIFQNVKVVLEKDIPSEIPIVNKVAKRIQTEVQRRSQQVLSSSLQDLFGFFGIIDAEDFAIKVCRQSFPVDRLEDFYRMVMNLNSDDFRLLLKNIPTDLTFAAPDPQTVDPSDVTSWGAFLAQCLCNMGRTTLQKASDLGIDSRDFIIQVCQAQYLRDFYLRIIGQYRNNSQELLQKTSEIIDSISEYSIPSDVNFDDLNSIAQFLAQCLYNALNDQESFKEFKDLSSLSSLKRNLCVTNEVDLDDVGEINIKNNEDLHAYLYQKYYAPFLEINEKINLLGEPRCRSQEFLNRFYDAIPPDEELHVFSFNVGQGNCIILRHGGDSAIIDTGKGIGIDKFHFEEFILPKITSLLQGTHLRAIFVTHPHEDHYNLISNLRKAVKDISECKVFLGGTPQDWKNGIESAKFYNTVKNIPNLFFVTDKVRNENNREVKITSFEDIFAGTNFQFILPLSTLFRGENACSFFLKVSHGSDERSFLFTGDADGLNLDKITGHVYKEEHSKLLWQSISPEFKHHIQRPIFNQKQQSEMSFYKENRKALQNIGVVFSPHHGTDTNGSQNIMTRLLASKNPPAVFVVSSVGHTKR